MPTVELTLSVCSSIRIVYSQSFFFLQTFVNRCGSIFYNRLLPSPVPNIFYHICGMVFMYRSLRPFAISLASTTFLSLQIFCITWRRGRYPLQRRGVHRPLGAEEPRRDARAIRHQAPKRDSHVAYSKPGTYSQAFCVPKLKVLWSIY